MVLVLNVVKIWREIEKPKMTDNMVRDPSTATYNLEFINNESTTNIDSSLTHDSDNFPCGYCQHILNSFPEMVNHIQNNHYKHSERKVYDLENTISTQGKFKYRYYKNNITN